MAYRIRMFGRAADPVAHHLCDVLTHAVQARDHAIEEIGERHQGLGWVSLTLWSVASEKWSAIAWDEGSGFDIRLDELTL